MSDVDAGSGTDDQVPHGPRVFVIDDHELVRRALTDLLADAGCQVVGEAGSVGQARPRLALLEPEVVVADIHLPDGSGTTLCAEFRRLLPDCSWVMLTSDPSDSAVQAAVDAGATGFALKNARPQELLERVLRAAGQSNPASTAALTSGAAAPESGACTRLTSQERQLLDLLGRGLSNREMADIVHLSEKTVKNYLSNLYRKLGVRNRTEAALVATRTRREMAAASWTVPPHVQPVRF